MQKDLIPAEISIPLEDLALSEFGLVAAGCRDLQASFTQMYWAGSGACEDIYLPQIELICPHMNNEDLAGI